MRREGENKRKEGREGGRKGWRWGRRAYLEQSRDDNDRASDQLVDGHCHVEQAHLGREGGREGGRERGARRKGGKKGGEKGMMPWQKRE